MSSARDKLLARKPQKLDIDGETFYVRAMTMRETLELQSLGEQDDAEQKCSRFAIATCLTDENGKPVFESEADDGLLDIPTDMLHALTRAINKVSTTPRLASAEKNSPETT